MTNIFVNDTIKTYRENRAADVGPAAVREGAHEMPDILGIICGILEITVGALSIGEMIISFFRPQRLLMPDHVAELIKARLRNPRGYLTTRRVELFLGSAAFTISGIGDLIGIYYIQRITKALWGLLIVAGFAVFLFGNHIYLDMWLPPKKPAAEKPHTKD